MAKLIAPLFSFGASGKLGNALVFFPWKGLDCVRSYVIPANPQTDDQITQRGYMTTIVDWLHVQQARATLEFGADDIAAWRRAAAIQPTSRTWFNEYVKHCLDQFVAGKEMVCYRAGASTPGVDLLDITMRFSTPAATAPTEGAFWYGTSPTAMIHSEAVDFVAGEIQCEIENLVTGVRYYFQFKSTLHNDFDGSKSGIYSDIPI